MGEAEREEVGTRERSFGEAQGDLTKRNGFQLIIQHTASSVLLGV